SAGVIVRSFVAIVTAETGVRDAEHILVGSARLPSVVYPTDASRFAGFNRIGAVLTRLSGVETVSLASNIPVYGVNTRPFEIQGRPNPAHDLPRAQFFKVSRDYFRVLGTPPTSGRGFDERDGASSLPVAIVNERFAATYWPGGQALGRRLRSVD